MSKTPTLTADSASVDEKGSLSTAHEAEYPEGGLRGWLAVAGSFLVYFSSFGVINSFGVFQVSIDISVLS